MPIRRSLDDLQTLQVVVVDEGKGICALLDGNQLYVLVGPVAPGYSLRHSIGGTFLQAGNQNFAVLISCKLPHTLPGGFRGLLFHSKGNIGNLPII